jgi:hypothetical protein
MSDNKKSTAQKPKARKMPEWLAERHRAYEHSTDECIETEFGHVLMGDAEQAKAPEHGENQA